MPRRKTREEFISDAIEVHGNKYDYNQVLYKNGTTKVVIICPIHGEFKQIPKQHIKGCGCRKCASVKNGQQMKLSKDDFISRAQFVHGTMYDYSNVVYENSYTKVEITCPIHGAFYQQPNNHLNGEGCPLCGIKKIGKRNIGYNDSYSKSLSVGYRVWSAMMDRCYNSKTQTKHPTYKDCKVCSEWHTFSNFEKWFNENYVEGWQLDKDLLVKGNREYAPSKCCFLPLAVNSFLTSKKTLRGRYVIGVSKSCDNKKFIATLGCLNKPHLGTFDTEAEAFNAYKIAKELRAKEIADEWKDRLPSNVYEALCNYKVEITD